MHAALRKQPLTPRAVLVYISAVVAISVFGVLGLGFAITFEWFGSVSGARFSGNWFTLGLALLATCVLTAGNLCIRWLRWHLILRRLGMMLPTRESALLYVATLPALLTPLRIGEWIRAVVLGRRYPRCRVDALTVWLIERASDLLVLVVFSALALSHPLVWCVCGLWILSVVLVRIRYRRKHQDNVLGLPALVLILAVTVLTWVLPIIAMLGVFFALNTDIDFLLAMQAFAQSTVFGNITGLPGGVVQTGSNLISHLNTNGVTLESAIIGVFLFRLGTMWFAVLLGVVACIVGRRGLAAMWTPVVEGTHFDDLSSGYADELPDHLIQRLLDRKTTFMQDRMPHCVEGETRGLDVGCGHGWYAARMAQNGHQMQAVDVSDGQVEQARAHVSALDLDLQCQAISPGKLPFPDNHFDFAYSINVIHHIVDEKIRAQTWQEIVRVLKPGGVFFLHEMNVTNPFFRFYIGYVYPIIRAIDEGTEKWVLPDALPKVPGATWSHDIRYFTFLPDFASRGQLERLAAFERRLETSRWKRWSAHYMACLQKNDTPTDPSSTHPIP